LKRLPNADPRFTCGSCRRFDGLAWCKQWNQPTSADAPICGSYLARKPGHVQDSAQVFPDPPDEVTPR
jgi:hypothetical protein